jgi:predicted RNA-binding protein Jag
MGNRNIVSKGKTVQDAIKRGLELLDLTKENVDIEVIEQEKKGLLGIGFKPAVVKLIERPVWEKQTPVSINEEDLINSILLGSDKEMKNEPEQSSQSFGLRQPFSNDKQVDISIQESDLEGKVWIKDGRIQCKDSPERYPTITPGKDVVLFKNGERIEGKTIIKESDDLKVDVVDERKETEWDIKLDSTKMKAMLKVQPGYWKQKKLKDQKPDHHIKLDITETIIPQKTLTISAILEKMLELGVVHGINHNEVVSACESTEAGEYVVATGNTAQPGENGWLEHMIELESTTAEPKERIDGSIDYREIRHIPSVEIGKVIATIHPPVDGKPGMTVTGVTLPPPPVHALKIVQGKGITLTNDDTQVVSTEAGRPNIEQRGILVKLSIMQKLLHQKDVDISSGNIQFNGDVEVTGSVEDSMKIEAKGDVLIKGNVNMANITAGNAIVINKNVIGSEITAGQSNMLIADMSQLLGEMADHTKQLVAAIDQLNRSPAFKIADLAKSGLSTLIKLLLEKKFRSYSTLVKQFVGMVQKGKNTLDEEWIEFANRLHRSFLINHPDGLKGLDDLTDLENTIDQFFQISTTDPEPNSSITIPYSLNSQIYCSGDVFVIGPGCYNTKIRSLGALQVKGLLRGGEYFAGRGVVVGEVGSEKGGVSTLITVPADQNIKINRVFEDTIIQIGKRKHQFKEESMHVNARLNDEGNLQLY